MANEWVPRNEYGKKLQDPRWQRKRLEVMERDGFKCANCGASDKQLHVHHSYYRRDADPWDYPRGSLVTVCLGCHAEVTEYQPFDPRSFFESICNAGFAAPRMLERLAGAFGDLDLVPLTGEQADKFLAVLCCIVDSLTPPGTHPEKPNDTLLNDAAGLCAKWRGARRSTHGATLD